MYMVTANSFIFLGIILGIFILQIFLSNTQSKWPGMILPTLTLSFTFFSIIGSMFFMLPGDVGFVTGSIPTILWTVFNLITTLIVSNIPTYILVIIYILVRNKKSKRTQIDNMNIRDL